MCSVGVAGLPRKGPIAHFTQDSLIRGQSVNAPASRRVLDLVVDSWRGGDAGRRILRACGALAGLSRGTPSLRSSAEKRRTSCHCPVAVSSRISDWAASGCCPRRSSSAEGARPWPSRRLPCSLRMTAASSESARTRTREVPARRRWTHCGTRSPRGSDEDIPRTIPAIWSRRLPTSTGSDATTSSSAPGPVQFSRPRHGRSALPRRGWSPRHRPMERAIRPRAALALRSR